MFCFSSTLLAASASSTLGWAATAKDAEVLVEKLVAEINAVISSGNSESVMVRQFEEIFKSYADVPTIARYALGNDARGLSQSQMEKFIKVYSVYVSHKYGRRFREFIGVKLSFKSHARLKVFLKWKRWHTLKDGNLSRSHFWSQTGLVNCFFQHVHRRYKYVII